MQYTAKKPFNSDLILHPDGLRYRFQEDHVFKDIRFAQVTKVKVKSDLYRKYFSFILAPFMIISQLAIGYLEGFHWTNISNALVWIALLCFYLGMKKVYFLHVIKGPLTAEVFTTHSRKEAYAIKAAIESRC